MVPDSVREESPGFVVVARARGFNDFFPSPLDVRPPDSLESVGTVRLVGCILARANERLYHMATKNATTTVAPAAAAIITTKELSSSSDARAATG